MIVTKTISRFARNTVTLLESVRELKGMGVDVFFEDQGIHSVSGDGELMLTILASFAQEESLSASENVKWSIHKKFENGEFHGKPAYGYRLTGGVLTVMEEEAAIVREIYADYLNGMGVFLISKKLRQNGVNLSLAGIRGILSNERYIGSMLLQKKYHENHLTKKERINRGEREQFYVENSHQAIIDRETWDAVQEIIRLRADAGAFHKPKIGGKKPVYLFTGLIRCGECGAHYQHRRMHMDKPHGRCEWRCKTAIKSGNPECRNIAVPEISLLEKTAEALGLPDVKAVEALDGSILQTRLKEIIVYKNHMLKFILSDGSAYETEWAPPDGVIWRKWYL